MPAAIAQRAMTALFQCLHCISQLLLRCTEPMYNSSERLRMPHAASCIAPWVLTDCEAPAAVSVLLTALSSLMSEQSMVRLQAGYNE